MSRIKVLEPKSFATLLKCIERYQNSREEVWYRGINNEKYELLPTLARTSGNVSEEELDQIEKGIAVTFSQRSPPFIDRDLSGPWRSLFYMQHYGVPTRLLDWSESPFVALYFALSNVKRKADGQPMADVALWMCDPVKWNRKALDQISYKGGILDESCDEIKAYSPDLDLEQRPTRPIMIYGTHNNPRIVAQRGVFSLFGKGMKSMQATFDEHKFPVDALQKVVINRTNVDEILQSLFRKGFTESTIYPDLFGLSLEIKRRFGYQ